MEFWNILNKNRAIACDFYIGKKFNILREFMKSGEEYDILIG